MKSGDPFLKAVISTRMPMVFTDPRLDDNPVFFVNDAFCELVGYPRAEILGRNCRFLQGPESDPAAIALIRAAVRAEQPISIDLQNHRKDGTPFWNRLHMEPVHDSEGGIVYFFASQIDITMERERLGNLVDGFAHDFNNLLGGILGSLELIQRRAAAGRTDGIERYTAAAVASAQSAAALIQRLRETGPKKAASLF